MADSKQINERRATRFEGVYQRPARKKKYEGKPDVTYTIDYYDPHTGKRVRKTIGNRSEGITAEYAKSVRQKLMSEAKIEVLEGIVPMAAKGVPTLHDAWLKYKKDWLEANNKPVTYNDTCNYEKHLKCSTINNRALNKITVQDLEKITATMRTEGYAPQTIKSILGLVRRIMNKAARWKMWRGISPFQDFEMPKVDNERTRYFTEDQMFAVFKRLREKNHRAWVMSLVSLQCGLRFSEIAKLEINDVDFEGNTLFIRHPKNGQSRYAAMTQTVREALAEWMKLSITTNPIFPNFVGKKLWNMDDDFRKIIDELGINNGFTERRDKITFDSLRQIYMSSIDGRELRRSLTETQIRTIFARLKEKSHRAWLICLISLHCGLGFAEIAALEIHDIILENKTLFIRMPRFGQARYVAMPQIVQDALVGWLNATQTSLVFPSAVGKKLWGIDDAFKEVIDELGLNDGVTENRDRLVFHSLRHTYASFLAKENYSELTLAKLLGHKSTEMTRRYSHLMPSTQQAIAAHVEKVIPINMEHRESLT